MRPKIATLDALFDLLADGQWHTLNEISALDAFRCVPTIRLIKVLNLFSEHGFIELTESGTRINPKLQTFWLKMEAPPPSPKRRAEKTNL